MITVRETRKTGMSHGEEGFGILEVVVSLLLLSLLAIGFIPLLMQSLRVSVSTSTLATATQLVAQQLEELRALDSRCRSLQVYAAKANVEDPAGQPLRARISEITCPPDTTVPTTVEVRVWVTARNETTIAEATTLVFVDR
jgi:type II secretory pathway pseudopilin PulG